MAETVKALTVIIWPWFDYWRGQKTFAAFHVTLRLGARSVPTSWRLSAQEILQPSKESASLATETPQIMYRVRQK
jgi:hypothetical protein